MVYWWAGLMVACLVESTVEALADSKALLWVDLKAEYSADKLA
jgi:hypothetical protein